VAGRQFKAGPGHVAGFTYVPLPGGGQTAFVERLRRGWRIPGRGGAGVELGGDVVKVVLGVHGKAAGDDGEGSVSAHFLAAVPGQGLAQLAGRVVMCSVRAATLSALRPCGRAMIMQ
jgi:hypothetical protein